ncbi:Villin, variant 2 [Stylosanthes scabra]|uniref:Villin, variant 2 n=2 Tax=Stylosanthes scabra TaxID=79078 RepID=A0ABU6RYE5_9FABA|nr:Villin, variant 2 [Stylosanthes scabra]
MTEDIFILDCHSEIFVWVGQGIDPKSRMQSLAIGEKFIENDFLLEKLSRTTPLFIVMEGSEPPFFTCFFKWEAAKSAMLGNSFQRKLTIVRNGGTPPVVKPKRRPSLQCGDKCQRSSRSMSVSPTPERVRVRGRSPAFNALASNFEKPKDRNLSTPPPIVRKIYPKSGTSEKNTLSLGLGTKSTAIARLTSSFDMPSAREKLIPRSLRLNFNTTKSNPERSDSEGSMSSRMESLTIEEDAKEGEADDDEGLPVYPYDQVNTASTDPVADIDVTKREAYLSPAEFKEKLGMAKNEFYKLPKWKQNKLKVAVQLF